MSEEAATLARVRNHRAGAFEIPMHTRTVHDDEGKVLRVLPCPKLVFEPGDTLVKLDDLNSLSEVMMDQMGDWINAGHLEMLPADLPPAPVEEPALDMSHVTALIPQDDAAAIELVKMTSDAATLDAMFAAVGERVTVSEAILARLTELDAK